MTKLCVVRHGETDWNRIGRLQGQIDIPLNGIGLQQAEECGRYLENESWDVIVSSPLLRAQKTAEIIQNKLNLPIVVMDDFVEMSFGEAEGLVPQERMDRFANQEPFPGQELQKDLNKRIMNGLDKINETYKGKRIVLVAHGRVINDMLDTFSKGELSGGALGIVNGCLSNFVYDNKQWRIENYNQISHLSHFSDKGKI